MADHVKTTVVALEGRDAWRAVVPVASVGAVLKRVTRAGGDYRRVPLPDGERVLVLTSVEVAEAERVAACDVAEVLEAALSDIRTVKGAKVSASRAWQLTAVEPAVEAETQAETAGEYVGNAVSLERFERVLSWWRDAKVERVRVNGYDACRAQGVTPQAVDALRRNGVLVHPDAVRAERAERARQRERKRAEGAALEARVAEVRATRAA